MIAVVVLWHEYGRPSIHQCDVMRAAGGWTARTSIHDAAPCARCAAPPLRRRPLFTRWRACSGCCTRTRGLHAFCIRALTWAPRLVVAPVPPRLVGIATWQANAAQDMMGKAVAIWCAVMSSCVHSQHAVDQLALAAGTHTQHARTLRGSRARTHARACTRPGPEPRPRPLAWPQAAHLGVCHVRLGARHR